MTATAGTLGRIAHDAVQGDQQYQKALSIYGKLKGPWESDDGHPVTNPLVNEIAEILWPHASWRDTSIAAVWMTGLIKAGFIVARKPDPDGRRVCYEKAKEPPAPDMRSWAERENELLRKAQREEQQRLDREYEFGRRAAEAVNAPQIAAERAQIGRHVRELGYVHQSELDAKVRAAVTQALAERGL